MPKRFSSLLLVVLLVGSGCSSRQLPASPPGSSGKATGQLFVWADADPDDGVVPMTVKLNCDLLQPVDKPRFFWDFGDGTAASREQNPTHIYRSPGRYRPRVVVTDPAGNRGDDETIVDVEAPD